MAQRGDEWVTIAVLGKPRGTRGEMFALPETSHWERFVPGRSFTLWFDGTPGRDPQVVVLEEGWTHNGKLILKLAGVDSIEDAEAVRGAHLCLRDEEREPLPEGEYYYDDLKGFAVVDVATGEQLGTVAGFTEGVGPGVLEVDSPRSGKAVAAAGVERWQVPFAKEICVDVDLAARQIRVKLPDGLRDLNYG
jgi:16S rRNA processing protein RimM